MKKYLTSLSKLVVTLKIYMIPVSRCNGADIYVFPFSAVQHFSKHQDEKPLGAKITMAMVINIA